MAWQRVPTNALLVNISKSRIETYIQDSLFSDLVAMGIM